MFLSEICGVCFGVLVVLFCFNVFFKRYGIAISSALRYTNLLHGVTPGKRTVDNLAHAIMARRCEFHGAKIFRPPGAARGNGIDNCRNGIIIRDQYLF